MALRSGSHRRGWSPGVGAVVASIVCGSSLMLAQGLVTTIVEDVPLRPPSYSIPTVKLRTHLAASGLRLYWTEGSEYPLRSIGLADGLVVDHVARMGVPHRPALAPPYVFYVDTREGSCTERALMRAAIDGTDVPLELGRADGCGVGTTDVVIDDEHAYWVQAATSPPFATILRTPRAGGTTAIVHSTNRAVASLAVDASALYWVEIGFPGPGGPLGVFKRPLGAGGPTLIANGVSELLDGNIVVEQGVVYFADGGALRAVPVSGGVVATLAATQERPRALAVAEGTAYWLEGATIRAVPVAGGPSRLVRDGLESPVGLAASGTDVVWTESHCCPVGGRVLATSPGGESVRVIAELIDAPRAVVMSGSDVYWTEGLPLAQPAVGAGSLARASISGGPRLTVAGGVSTSTFTPFSLDQTHIYLADKFTLKRVPLAGGQPELMFRGPGGPQGIVDVALAGDQVVWVDESGVRKMPTQGGALTTLATANLPVRLAINSTHAVWIDWDGLHSVPLSGGATVTLSPLRVLSDLAVDEAFAYVADQDSGLLARVSTTGGAVQTLGYSSGMSKTSIELDDAYLYWIDPGQATVNRMPKAGGAAVQIAGGVGVEPFIAGALARDATGLSWTEVPARRIRRAGPPVPPTLTVEMTRSSVDSGDRFTLLARLRPGSGTAPVDAYVVHRLPDGGLRSLQVGGGFAPGLAPLAGGFIPFSYAGELASFTIDGTWAPGRHEWLVGLARPNTLQVIGPVTTVPFTVGPAALPSAPTLLPARVDGSAVHLEWAAGRTGGAVGGYRLEAGSGPGLSDIVPRFGLARDDSAVTFQGVPRGTYYVRLRAFNWLGVSSPSAEQRIVVP